MCRKVFIAATGQHCGKTTISVSLMHLARQKYGRVGYVKPIGPKCVTVNGLTMDKDAALMAKLYGLEADRACMSPVVLGKGSTKQLLDGTLSAEAMRERIIEACAELEQKNDFLIIEGAGHGGVGSVVGLNNAQVARMLGAPVVMVTGGGIGSVIDAVQLNLALYREEGADVRLVMANKLFGDQRASTLDYLQRAFAGRPQRIAGAFDFSPVLANPTLQNIARMFNQPLRGDQNARGRIVHHIQLGAASSQKVIDGLMESTLLLTTSSRDELIVTASSLYHSPGFREKLAGLVIPGHAPISAISQRILDDSGIPYIRVEMRTAEAFTRLSDHVSKISPEDEEKLALITSTAEASIDFALIDSLL